MSQKNEWEQFFSENAATEWYPSEVCVRALCSYRKEFGSAGKKVLDLGCGNGRHVWLAAKEGFDVYGIDLSENAITLAKEWMARDHLSYKDLRSGDISQPLPYEENFFDIVISYGALDHMPLTESTQALAHARRVLKPGGLVVLKLEANSSFTSDFGTRVAKNEVILDKPVEKGMLQHFFDQIEIADFVKDLQTIKSFREDARRFDDLNTNYQSRWIFIGKK